MLRHNRLNNSSLEYLRPSPVRGQLEPQDPKTAKGWRYLQTTDTLDELKVSKGKKTIYYLIFTLRPPLNRYRSSFHLIQHPCIHSF